MSPRKLIRTVRFHELGGPELLTIDSLASPSLQATDVRIAVKVVGLNRADAMFRRGSYIEKADFPSRIGYEASGIVIEVGEEVNHLRLGDEACIVPQMGLSQNGCYAEELVVPNKYKVGRTLVVGEVSLYSEGVSDLVAHAVGTCSIPPYTS